MMQKIFTAMDEARALGIRDPEKIIMETFKTLIEYKYFKKRYNLK